MTHRDSVDLTTDPAQHPHVFANAFNTFRPEELERVYEPDGVLVPEPGSPVTGADRAAANLRLQSLRVPISVRPRHVYAVDDIALLVVDWVIDGVADNGEHVHVEGTATDVARRGTDGCWRYVIDNPRGTA